MIKGIDISSHNGNVSMEKIRTDGIEFIILRVGYGKKNIDKKFFQNYNEALKNNLHIGIYLYSYATNKKEAEEEAKFVLKTISNLKVDYPIFIDMEDSDLYKEKHNVSYNTCIEICKEFCTIIENAGYYAGIYASLDWLNNKINSTQLDKFDKWVAQWGEKCTYKKKYGMWQYSNKGKVSGISGCVDLDYSLKDYSQIIKEKNLNQFDDFNDYYIVKKGDTLIKISNYFNIEWHKLYELNKDVIGNNPNMIKIGQILKIKEN